MLIFLLYKWERSWKSNPRGAVLRSEGCPAGLVKARQLLEKQEIEPLCLVRPGLPRLGHSHSQGWPECVPRTNQGTQGVGTPKAKEVGSSLRVCRLASVSLGKDTLRAGVSGQDPGRWAGAGEISGPQEARRSSAQHPCSTPPPAHRVPCWPHRGRFSCSMAEGGGESSSCRNQEQQVF